MEPSIATEQEILLPTDLARLTSLVDEKPESFMSGDSGIREAALDAAKYVFDLTLKSETRAQSYIAELLEEIEPSQAPKTRSKARAAAKTVPSERVAAKHAILQPTPLSSLFVTGMDEDQIWAQLDLKARNLCETLEDTFDAGEVDARGMRDLSEDDQSGDEMVELDSDEMEGLEGEEMDMDMDGQDWEMDDSEDDESSDKDIGEDEEEDAGDDELEVKIAELRDPSSDEDEASDEDGDTTVDLDAGPSSKKPNSKKLRKKGHAELDDGFFNLADFNAEIEQAESKSVSHGALADGSDDDNSDNEEVVDLFAPVDDVEAFEEEDIEAEAGEPLYRDFFEAPRRQPSKGKGKPGGIISQLKPSKVRFNDEVKVKTIKSNGRGRSLSSADIWTGKGINVRDEGPDKTDDKNTFGDEDGASSSDEESDDLNDGREAIERLKDDLFADDEEKPQSGMSAHETRMAALREQIAALEAENVGEKDWVLKGEVTSRARPQNGLLEEDLEYEHVMKAVPVVTEEVVQDLEARIKARIIEDRFDDVVRKKAVDDKPFLPSRLFELQDTKSKESLAQLYEKEYVASQNGGTVDDRDGKLQKEHEEIEKLWEGICYKLDALCNAHFTPKQPKAIISTVSNVSAITLESALPTAKAASTILAPEEVFAPSPSDLLAKSELTPTEKQALRNKERKKKKKQRDILEKSVDKFAKMNGVKGVKKQKEAALKSVVKNGKGVTIIGKKSQKIKNTKGAAARP